MKGAQPSQNNDIEKPVQKYNRNPPERNWDVHVYGRGAEKVDKSKAIQCWADFLSVPDYTNDDFNKVY